MQKIAISTLIITSAPRFAEGNGYSEEAPGPLAIRKIGAARECYLFGEFIFNDKTAIDIKNRIMNSQTTGLYVASTIFAIFALGHAYRLLARVTVVVANHVIPMGLSWVALIFGCVLSIWLWQLARTAG